MRTPKMGWNVLAGCVALGASGTTMAGCGNDDTVMSWSSEPVTAFEGTRVSTLPGSSDPSFPIGDVGTLTPDGSSFGSDLADDFGDYDSVPSYDEEISELQVNQDAWAAENITHYQMTFTSTCGLNQWYTVDPVTVEVQNGQATLAPGSANSLPAASELPTVETLFDLIAGAYDPPAEFVTVDYAEYGYPSVIDIDYFVEATDDEVCFMVDDLTVLS